MAKGMTIAGYRRYFLWEGNGNSHFHNSDTVMEWEGNRESFYGKKIAGVQPAKKN